MASFTDTVPQFTQYRPEFPVDAALMVGMQKESEFMEGVKRVQGFVSSLHGFDIMKPETRSYLEGKVGEMRTAVNSVSGDFSDQRLTNAIGGLKGKIASDPVVQNGVASTAIFRKGQADIEASKKDGKYSVENEWDFMNEGVKWLNDGDYTTKFSHQYTPYTDVRKKVMEVIKTLGENTENFQNPFVTDSKGNISIDPTTGQPILNYDMIEKHYKGKSADRIINAINASLDSNDFNQLSISGRYTMRGTQPIELQQDIEKMYKDRKMSIVNAIAELSVDKLINTSDPQHQKELDEKIEGYKNELSKVDIDYNAELQTLADSPDATKSSLYIKSFLNGISQAFTTEERWTKYLDNPAFNNFMQQKQYELDKWWKEEDLKLKYIQEQRLQFESLMKGEKAKKGTLEENDYSYGATDYPSNTTISTPTELSFRDKTNELEEKKYEILDKIVDGHAHDEYEQWKKVSQSIEVETGKPLNKKSFLEATYKKLKTSWDEKKDLPQSVEEQMTMLKDLDYEVETRQQSLRKIKDKADQQYPSLDNVTAATKIETKTYTFGDGKKINLTGEDFVNIAILKNEDAVFKTKGGKERYNEAKKRLENKFGEHTAWLLYGTRNPMKDGSVKDSYQVAENSVTDPTYTKRRDFINTELEKSGLTGKPQQYTIKMEKGEDKNRVTSFLTSYRDETKRTGGNTHPEYDKDALFDAISASKGYSVSVVRVPSSSKYMEDTFEANVTNNNDGTITRLYLTPQQAEQITAKDFTVKTSKILDRLQLSQTGTTNYESSSLTGKYAGRAFLTREDFPNVQVPIKADIAKSSESGKYFITLYTQKDGGDWISKEARTPGSRDGKPSGMTIEQVESFLLNLNDSAVQYIFNK